MEILATTQYKGFYVLTLAICIIICLIFLYVSIIGIKMTIKEWFDFNSVMALLICVGISTFFGYATYRIHNEGIFTEYKAKVTDFNEVYKNGYKITDQEGEIYILEKN